MKRKSFVAVACAAAMIASMTSGITVFAEENTDFSGEELSILVSAGWMDNRYDATIERFEDTYGVTVDLQTIPADQYSDLLQSKLATDSCADVFWIQSNPFAIESTIVDPEKLLHRLYRSISGKTLCRKQERLPVYTMINYTDFRSGTIPQSM